MLYSDIKKEGLQLHEKSVILRINTSQYDERLEQWFPNSLVEFELLSVWRVAMAVMLLCYHQEKKAFFILNRESAGCPEDVGAKGGLLVPQNCSKAMKPGSGSHFEEKHTRKKFKHLSPYFTQACRL